MKKIKLSYREGTWFAVPLIDGSYGAGVVARAGRSGKVLLGYFFGPRSVNVPSLDSVILNKPKDATLVCIFGDLGLVNDWWPIIGQDLHFSRQEWPLPRFLRSDDNRAELIEYDEDNLLEEKSVERVQGHTSVMFPKDALFGYEAVQIKLNLLIPAKSNQSL